MPEVALFASEYESRSYETDGILMELLVHKKHMKNLDVLADTKEKISEYIGTTLREVKEAGLCYPYDGLTLVEVPTVLRTYGGGWRLDTGCRCPVFFSLGCFLYHAALIAYRKRTV